MVFVGTTTAGGALTVTRADSLSRPAVAPGHQMIAGRGVGGYSFDARGGHVANAIDGDPGSIGGAPGQHDLIACRDHGGGGGDLSGGRRRDYRGWGRGGGWQRLLLFAACNRDQCEKQYSRNQDAITTVQLTDSFHKFKGVWRASGCRVISNYSSPNLNVQIRTVLSAKSTMLVKTLSFGVQFFRLDRAQSPHRRGSRPRRTARSEQQFTATIK